MRSSLTPHKRRLSLILAIYLALALGYGVATPIFEAPDEHHHYFTVQFIADNGRLPRADADPGLARQEAAQPPLFYLMGAALVAPLDAGDAAARLWPNPFVALTQSRPQMNVNAFVHTAAEAWPWQGYALAVHLLRALNALIGLGTLLCLYAAARRRWPDTPQRALLATGLVAFLPQFAFLHGAVNNDGLIIFFSTAVLWQLLRLWEEGISDRRLLLLGGAIGLAILSKMTGLLLLFLALAVVVGRVAIDGERPFPHRLRPLPRCLLLLLLPALLIAGWLLWRNWSLYGDPTAANQFVALAGGARDYTWRQIGADLDRVFYSFFAVFGWMTVFPPPWLHGVWSGILLIAGLGFIVALGRAPERLRDRSWRWSRGAPLLFLLGWALLVGVAWLRFMQQTPADQGRLLFPALLPGALAMTMGLSAFRARLIPALALLGALASSVYGVTAVIPRAYALPELLPATALPETAVPLRQEMGQGLTLLAAEPNTETARPGEWVTFTLYWTAAQRPETAPVVAWTLFGREEERVGENGGYHGRGLYPASLWPAGGETAVAERVTLRLDETTATPVQARLLVALTAVGDSAVAGTVKVVPAEWPPLTPQPLATLADGIQLAAASLSPPEAAAGETITVRLRWQTTGDVSGEWKTFVHLGDPARPPLAQADGEPVNGRYPTRLWEAGEVIDDAITLTLPPDLPAGTYPVQVGMYERSSGARLPIVVDEARLPHDAYRVGSVTTTR